jgi:hypothetical protein
MASRRRITTEGKAMMTEKERLDRLERALGEIVYTQHAAGVSNRTQGVWARLARTAPASAELLSRYIATTEPLDDTFVGRRETPETDRPALEHRKEAA